MARQVIQPTLFSSDHWGVLIHIENRAVDHFGRVDKRLLRRNDKGYTRLGDGTVLDGLNEWHILDDLIAAGLVTYNKQSERYGLTEVGWCNAHKLRRLQAANMSFDYHRYEACSDMDFAGLPDGKTDHEINQEG